MESINSSFVSIRFVILRNLSNRFVSVNVGRTFATCLQVNTVIIESLGIHILYGSLIFYNLLVKCQCNVYSLN